MKSCQSLLASGLVTTISPERRQSADTLNSWRKSSCNGCSSEDAPRISSGRAASWRLLRVSSRRTRTAKAAASGGNAEALTLRPEVLQGLKAPSSRPSRYRSLASAAPCGESATMHWCIAARYATAEGCRRCCCMPLTSERLRGPWPFAAQAQAAALRQPALGSSSCCESRCRSPRASCQVLQRTQEAIVASKALKSGCSPQVHRACRDSWSKGCIHCWAPVRSQAAMAQS
mmetsp:Transcript_13909/g.43629  ORF Transcript_13909/g.43629 Transcript_13909/m.43629 type:complete len:231 (-) Transcript_13909:1061-1753(-)